MTDKTVIQSGKDLPSVKCKGSGCGKSLPIFDNLGALPDTFEKKCGFCEETYVYSKTDIVKS
ncbi:MAG: hypothetical protein MJA83_01575 [Gammaproteobacteria bacterium]|nr:hypothetical protein [Gammaproteobacteria bacterium]